MSAIQAGCFPVSTIFLEGLLQLPEGHSIIGAEWDFCSKTIRLYVSGPMMPVCPTGMRCQEVIPVITQTMDGMGRQVFTWKIMEATR